MNLYPYQQEALLLAKKENIIVHLPTGTGKTLIAAKVIDHFCDVRPTQATLCIAPTKVLCSQQAAYFEKHCEGKKRAAEVHGSSTDRWTKAEWTRCLQKNKILVGTPAVFLNAFRDGKIKLQDFNLLVFDECHNAVHVKPKCSPYIHILIHAATHSPPSLSHTLVSLALISHTFITLSLSLSRFVLLYARLVTLLCFKSCVMLSCLSVVIT